MCSKTGRRTSSFWTRARSTRHLEDRPTTLVLLPFKLLHSLLKVPMNSSQKLSRDTVVQEESMR